MTICGCVAGSKGTVLQTEQSLTTAVITLGIQGDLSAEEAIGAVDITLNLPSGVTARHAESGMTADGVISLTGSAEGALAAGRFIPAAGPAPAQLRVAVIKVPGFRPGNFAIVKFDMKGVAPSSEGFSIAQINCTGSKGNPLKGLTATLSLQTR